MEKKILLIDDRVSLPAKRKLLLEKGYSISTAGTKENGLNKAKSIKPHLILVGINLVGECGIKVIQEIRKNNYKGKMIAFSGTTQNDNEIEKAGCNIIMTTPIYNDEVEIFLFVIETLLSETI